MLGIGVATLGVDAVETIGRSDSDAVVAAFGIDGSVEERQVVLKVVIAEWVNPCGIDQVSASPHQRASEQGNGGGHGVWFETGLGDLWAAFNVRVVVRFREVLDNGAIFLAGEVGEGCHDTTHVCVENADVSWDHLGTQSSEGNAEAVAPGNVQLVSVIEGGIVAEHAVTKVDDELVVHVVWEEAGDVEMTIINDVEGLSGLIDIGGRKMGRDGRWVAGDGRRVAGDGRRVAGGGNSSGDDGGDAKQLHDGQ